jgi:hypothetical protein
MAEPKFIYVKGNRNDGRVALSEVDEAHPGGSVFVAHRMVRKVAKTAFVNDQLHDGALVETDDADDKKEADEFLKRLLESESQIVAAEGRVSDKYDGMSPKQLSEEAKGRGLSFEGRVSKKEVIAALEADDAAKSSGIAPSPPVQAPSGDVPDRGEAATHGA